MWRTLFQISLSLLETGERNLRFLFLFSKLEKIVSNFSFSSWLDLLASSQWLVQGMEDSPSPNAQTCLCKFLSQKRIEEQLLKCCTQPCWRRSPFHLQKTHSQTKPCIKIHRNESLRFTKAGFSPIRSIFHQNCSAGMSSRMALKKSETTARQIHLNFPSAKVAIWRRKKLRSGGG